MPRTQLYGDVLTCHLNGYHMRNSRPFPFEEITGPANGCEGGLP
jgi:hypothetical protein